MIFRIVCLAKPPHGHSFSPQAHQHKDGGSKLRQNCRSSRSGYAHMEAEDKDWIQNDIEHGSQHDGHHTQAGKALGNQKAVHARG